MPGIDVLLFTTDAPLARRAIDAGLGGLVVDWEDRRASSERTGCDDGAAPDSAEDLRRLAAIGDAPVVCRINAVGPWTHDEIERALDHGATDVLVPMVETAADVDVVVAQVKGRARVGIMIETVAACDRARELARAPMDFVYVGLLDLAICRREGNVFHALADGTADRLREAFASTRFGIGGVTVIDKGSPVPCRELLAELARLDTHLAFARRSFLRDIAGRNLASETRLLAEAWDDLRARPSAVVEADHRTFVARHGASRPR